MTPYLQRFATSRPSPGPARGRYCTDLDQWVVPTALGGEVPLVDADAADLVTETRVRAEGTDAADAGSVTETAIGGEQPDRGALISSAVTMTEVKSEQPDASGLWAGLITVTDVAGEAPDR